MMKTLQRRGNRHARLAPPAFAASRDAAFWRRTTTTAGMSRYDSLLNRLGRDAARRGSAIARSP
jgi:hypothetical protein